MFSRSIIILLVSFLTGCAALPPSGQYKEVNKMRSGIERCQFIERNLTVSWDNRSYWCNPTR